jgi:DNA (cytosine-5)-methyltransferase 1
MKVVSLFTGAGGLDIGLERSGFEIAGCVEMNKDCRATLHANRPDWPLIEPGDIHAHRASDIIKAMRVSDDAALVVGGPPCQPFSKSARWQSGTTAGMNDPRAQTLPAFFEVVAAALPDFVLLENVKGITATRNRVTEKYQAFDVVRSSLERINRRHGVNYQAASLAIDSAHYGVAQHRQRVFVFAARDGVTLELPTATNAAAATTDVDRLATAWDALWDLDDPDFDPALRPTGSWADLLPTIPEGSNYLFHTHRGAGEPLFGWRRRYWSFLLKLAKNRPSWTVQAQAGPATGPFHWRSRKLSVAELARLQCFPDDWKLVGTPASARRQVGNAVPPPIGEQLGLAIRRQLLGADPAPISPALTPALRDGCPDPEPVQPVPEHYLSLRGADADHPGPGLGPGIRPPDIAESDQRAA